MVKGLGPKYLNNGTLNGAGSRRPIGVFDSGVGGLTVFEELRQMLPNESILYFGDTAHLPYGTKTAAEILHLVRNILDWMVSREAKMVIMACNTSSALALETVQAEYDIPIMGVILPAAREAVHIGKRIGVIATPATAQSHAYRNAIHEISPQSEVWEIGCPEFVPIVEGNRIHSPETRSIVQRYLHPLIEDQIDTLIYGCTHYPHLAPVICDLLPPSVNIINPARHVSIAAKQELEMLSPSEKNKGKRPSKPQTEFFVSDRPRRFSQVATQLLGYCPPVQKQNVDKPAARLQHKPSAIHTKGLT